MVKKNFKDEKKVYFWGIFSQGPKNVNMSSRIKIWISKEYFFKREKFVFLKDISPRTNGQRILKKKMSKKLDFWRIFSQESKTWNFIFWRSMNISLGLMAKLTRIFKYQITRVFGNLFLRAKKQIFENFFLRTKRQ